MNEYIFYLLQANIGLLLFAFAYIIFLQKEPVFLLKRFLILALLIAAALLPQLSFDGGFSPLGTEAYLLNGYHLPAFLLTAEGAEATPKTKPIDMIGVGLGIYWLVTSFLFFQVLLRLTALVRRTLTIPVIGRIGSVNIYEISTNEPAFSFFNHIFIGQLSGLDKSAKDKIINHELVHCKEWHSLDILFVEMLRILFWFNPATYLLKNALIEVHEYRADQLSVVKGEEQEYCSLIAKLALNGAGYPLVNHFNKSLTLKRIAMIKSDKAGANWWKFTAMIPVASVFFLSVSCEQQPLESVDEIERAKEVVDEETFTIVEEYAAFPGGGESLFQFLGKNLTYPNQAKTSGVEGRVLVEFVVDKDGSITNTRIVEGIGSGCDEEALRVIQASSPWHPAKQRGKVVRQRFILPVHFSLNPPSLTETSSQPIMVGEKLKIQSFQAKKEGTSRVITGVANDESGGPLPGINVLIAGTTTGTVTDMNGSFKLVTEAENGEIVFSFVGYNTERVAF